MKRSRLVVLLALGGALTSALLVHCKSERVTTVEVTLGVDNGGSQGFACSEAQPPVCPAFVGCQLRERERTLECLLGYCRDAGSPPECQALAECIRSPDSTPVACYDKACPPTKPLVARGADDAGTVSLHVIVEYVKLGGLPGCRVAELQAWCRARPASCKVMRRTCVPVSFAAPLDASPAELSRRVAEAVAKQQTIDDDAPREPVLVRIVGIAKAGACEDSESNPSAPYAGEPVGCAYSCPLVLTSVEGEILVDVDLVKDTCSVPLIEQCLDVFVDAGF